MGQPGEASARLAPDGMPRWPEPLRREVPQNPRRACTYTMRGAPTMRPALPSTLRV